jgi:hypothetical protein
MFFAEKSVDFYRSSTRFDTPQARTLHANVSLYRISLIISANVCGPVDLRRYANKVNISKTINDLSLVIQYDCPARPT